MIALAKICFFHIAVKHAEIIVMLVDKYVTKPEYPEMHRTYAQKQKEAPSLSSPWEEQQLFEMYIYLPPRTRALLRLS